MSNFLQNSQNQNTSSRSPRFVIWFLVILSMSLFVGYLAFASWQGLWPFAMEQQQACTQEVKLCPDGSYVGRTGPNCEFAECPPDPTADWQTYRNEEYGFEFGYPGELYLLDRMDYEEKAVLLNFSDIEYNDFGGGYFTAIEINITDSVLNQQIVNGLENITRKTLNISGENVDVVSGSYKVVLPELIGGNVKLAVFINKSLTLYANDVWSSKKQEELDLLTDQILSTFRFTR